MFCLDTFLAIEVINFEKLPYSSYIVIIITSWLVSFFICYLRIELSSTVFVYITPFFFISKHWMYNIMVHFYSISMPIYCNTIELLTFRAYQLYYIISKLIMLTCSYVNLGPCRFSVFWG